MEAVEVEGRFALDEEFQCGVSGGEDLIGRGGQGETREAEAGTRLLEQTCQDKKIVTIKYRKNENSEK